MIGNVSVDLLAEISGSGINGNAPRSAFALEPASPDPEAMIESFGHASKITMALKAPPSAWLRKYGLFDSMLDFDFDSFFSGADRTRNGITPENIAAVLKGGAPRKEAVKKLQEITGCGSSAAYSAFSTDGKFGE